MKKFALLLTMCFSTILCFSQSDTREEKVCGFPNSSGAFQWAHYQSLVNAFENPDETFSYTDVTYEGNSWCYTNHYYCGTAPLNVPKYRLNGKPLDTRSITECGYAGWRKAKAAGELAQKTAILAPGEMWSSTEWDETCTSNCCYTITFYCDPLQPVQPLNANIPALPADKYMSCRKILYGPTSWTYYSTYQDAENGAAGWLAEKTDVIPEAVNVIDYTGTMPFETLYRVEISYTRSKCY